MNKNVVIAIVAVLVLAVVGVFAYKMSKKTMTAAPAQVMQVATPTTAPVTSGNVRGTIKSLMTAGKSEVCSYTNQVNGANITGKIYVADSKMRGDFTVVNTAKNETVNSHMIINDGQTMYAWTDLSARGMKMSLASAASVTPAAGANSNSPDVNQEVQFTCSGWTTDASMFTVPTNVTFYAISVPQVTGMATGAGAGTGVANPACSACANLPAAAHAACKSQLNCN